MKTEKEKLIESYSDKDVEHVEPLKHVFLKPTMYLGSVETPQHTLEEAVMNAVDEVRIGVAENIWVTLFEDGSISVRDDGRGVPPEYSEKFGEPTLRALFTKINTGKALAGDTVGASQHGVGMKAVVATSEWFEVSAFKNGRVYRDRYELIGDKSSSLKNLEPGVPVVKLSKKGELPSEPLSKGFPEHGTEVRWFPSGLVFSSNKFRYKTVRSFLHDLCYLNPTLTIHLKEESSGKEETLSETEGVGSLVLDLAKKEELPLITPVYRFTDSTTVEVHGKEEVVTAEIAFAWSSGTNRVSKLFTNNVPNPLLGTPVSGTATGLVRLVNKYGGELGLTKASLKSRDILPGLVLVVNLTHPAPQFNGQAKKEVTNPEAVSALNSLVYRGAQIPIDRMVESFGEVVKLALKREQQRKKEEAETFNLNDKSVKTAMGKKLADCRVTGPGKGSELFIVEGDSAGGTVHDKKDPSFQAMLPVRGKVLNVYKAPVAKALANEEIGSLFAALGTGIFDDFRIDKRRYDRIIIATDQDPDGAAISNLILSVLLRFTPDLIRQGLVYRVLTPLFVNTLRGGEQVYTYSDQEQDTFLKKNRRKVVGTQRNKGLGELFPEEVEKTVVNPETRRLIQYCFPSDEEGEQEAFDIVDKLMGSETESRKKMFFDPDLYKQLENEKEKA